MVISCVQNFFDAMGNTNLLLILFMRTNSHGLNIFTGCIGWTYARADVQHYFPVMLVRPEKMKKPSEEYSSEGEVGMGLLMCATCCFAA